jgi:hypothetical protein
MRAMERPGREQECAELRALTARWEEPRRARLLERVARLVDSGTQFEAAVMIALAEALDD